MNRIRSLAARLRGLSTSIGPASALGVVALALAAGCNVNDALARISEARRLSADLLVQFTKAADSANRAVMAGTDESSVAFATEAERANQAVQKDVDALRPVLQGLGYDDEMRLLDAFAGCFANYRAIDRTILDLAVENSNLKAQQLSFGPARESANAFRDALGRVTPTDARDGWRIKALVATAVGSVREIQALQAPHIADADDSVMTRLETQMKSSETEVRRALETLAPLVTPAARAHLAEATTALDRFMSVHTQIMSLSRRNTNVRSLAMSLNQKGPIIAACENSLHALRAAIAKRGFTGTR